VPLFDSIVKSAAMLARPSAAVPAPIEGAVQAAGMGPSTYLGPGRPQAPVEGFSGVPRRFDYPVGVNMALSSRASFGRTSWETLRELMRVYGVAQDCKNHKIDEIRSMEPLFTPAPGAKGDAELAVEVARKALEYPDREHPFEEWTALLFENMLTFDAGPIKRRRNRFGDVIGWENIDAPTILPYLDEHGRRPLAPAPAYAQKTHGIVREWFTAEDMYYLRFRPQTDSPYGMAPLESILLNANTDIRFQWHLLQMFTEGNIPGGFMEVPPDISSPDQVAEWQAYWNALYKGEQSIAGQLIAVPNGANFIETTPRVFDKAFPEYLAMQTARAFGVVPQDIGILSDVNRSTADAQGETQFRVKTLVWVYFFENLLNRMVQRDLGLPVQVKLDTGREQEDRLIAAQAWKIYIESGMASPDEGREELLGLPIDNEAPTPRIMVIGQSIVPLPKGGDTDPESMVDEEPKAPGAVEPPMPQLPPPPASVAKAGEAGPKVGQGGTSSWRDTPENPQPQHEVDLRLTDYWAPRVQDALGALWTDGQLQEAVEAAQSAAEAGTGTTVAKAAPEPSPVQRAAEAALAAGANDEELRQVVQAAWADAYGAGTMAAQVQLGEDPSGWSTWQPGFADPTAITGGGGLTAALADADVTIKGIVGTTLDRLAGIVEQGVIAGDSVDAIGRALRDVVDDPARAELIAHTESARLLTGAAVDTYLGAGVTQWDLVTSSSGVCGTCLDVAFMNPHPLSDTGDMPPLHPRCRCAASPHVEGR
jgi:hypothetical protein